MGSRRLDDPTPDLSTPAPPATATLDPSPGETGLTRREFLAGLTTTAALAAGGSLLQSTAAADQAGSTVALAPSPPSAIPATTVPVTLRINARDHTLDLDPRTTLLDALREHLGLQGSKKGCDQGQCGACTVLIDDRRINACLTLAVAAAGSSIVTVEGLAHGEELHSVQEAFIKHDAFQCGYCTPGQVCSAVGLLHEGYAHNDEQIRELMSGNICRCGAYVNILAAVKEAMRA